VTEREAGGGRDREEAGGRERRRRGKWSVTSCDRGEEAGGREGTADPDITRDGSRGVAALNSPCKHGLASGMSSSKWHGFGRPRGASLSAGHGRRPFTEATSAERHVAVALLQ